jgi:tetratricopeptide (TPR) repeat protein
MSKTCGRPDHVLDHGALEQLGLDFEIDLYETSLVDSPDDEEVLSALGYAYTRRGQHENGLAVDRRLVELSPGNAVYTYNLACSLSLLRLIDDAFLALERAVDLGFDDRGLLGRDPDLGPLRADPRFPDILSRVEQP